MNSDTEKAKQIIADNIYMTIATAYSDGKPWISPVFFAYDESYNLYWTSNKDALHSQLIRANPQVAIIIFDSKAPEGTGDGVYFEAKAFELQDPIELQAAMKTLAQRVSVEEFKVRQVEQVINDAVWRIYKAVPTVVS